MATTLAMLGVEAAMVVHGDGLDEIALHGVTRAVLHRDGRSVELELTPEEAGLERQPLETLRGGEPDENAAALRQLLDGEGSPAYRDAVALNAGALLWTAGLATSLADGTEQAGLLVDSGRCGDRLRRWIEFSHA